MTVICAELEATLMLSDGQLTVTNFYDYILNADYTPINKLPIISTGQVQRKMASVFLVGVSL